MRDTIRDVLAAMRIGFVLLLFALSWGNVFRTEQYPVPELQTSPADPKKDNQGFSGETFWETATTDPVAYFTLWLTFFTGVLAISTIGLWIVTWRASVAQAGDMKDSIDAAKSSADAAKKSADVAERGLHELNRAFVFVKEIKPAPSATEGAIDIWIVWENNETTQTKSMRTLVMAKEFPSDIPKDFDYPDDPKEDPGAASLGPKGAVSAAPITLPSQILVNLASGKHHYLVWGWVEYDDIFFDTKRHRTEFAAELKVSAVAGGESYSIVPVIRRNYNGSDEECGSRFIRAQKTRPRIVAADQDLAPLTQVAAGTVT